MLHASRSMFRTWALLLLPVLAISVYSPRTRPAIPAASKTVDFSAFGGFVHDIPDYGPYGNNGVTFGVDITRYFHFPVQPSLEARVNVATGKTVRENTYLFGIRAQGSVLRRYHPYADLLVGPGTIHFQTPPAPGYTGDNSTVWSYGGGLDVDFLTNFQAKIDFQYQSWNLGTNYTLSPSLTVIGIGYRIPFRPHNRQSRHRLLSPHGWIRPHGSGASRLLHRSCFLLSFP